MMYVLVVNEPQEWIMQLYAHDIFENKQKISYVL